MRLLNTRTWQLDTFMDDRKVFGRYAILSHTWGDEEVAFEEIYSDSLINREGFRKIQGARDQALADGIDYLWCDTCCIDKKSSAELSEAINSMYRWYYNAKVCYVYLSDFSSMFSPEDRFHRCRWFYRGWTLQELIAPQKVVFFDASWKAVATKSKVANVISLITKIDEEILLDRDLLQAASVAKRMSFAASRKTTRLEDQAYSLLGIFDVNMPLLYGEGRKAFQRLQEEIIRTWVQADHSILAWDRTLAHSSEEPSTILAQSPYYFSVGFYKGKKSSKLKAAPKKNDIISWPLPPHETFELSNKGLRLSLCVRPFPLSQRHQDLKFDILDHKRLVGALQCSSGAHKDELLAVILRLRSVRDRASGTRFRNDDADGFYDIEDVHEPVEVAELRHFSQVVLTIIGTPSYNPHEYVSVRIEWKSDHYSVGNILFGKWNQKQHMFDFSGSDSIDRYGILAFSLSRQAGSSCQVLPRRLPDDLLLHINYPKEVKYGKDRQPKLRLLAEISRPLTSDSRHLRTCNRIDTKVDAVPLLLDHRAILSVNASYTIIAGRVLWNLTINDANAETSSQPSSNHTESFVLPKGVIHQLAPKQPKASEIVNLPEIPQLRRGIPYTVPT